MPLSPDIKELIDAVARTTGCGYARTYLIGYASRVMDAQKEAAVRAEVMRIAQKYGWGVAQKGGF